MALIGADGAGKTSLAHWLAGRLPGPTLYVYMGINSDASSIMLPTTRLIRAVKLTIGANTSQGGPRRASSERQGREHSVRLYVLLLVRRWLRLVNLLAEEWYRHLVERRARAAGATVLRDRDYFFDYYSHDILHSSRRTPLRRLHGWFLHQLPRPDLTILLDAAPEVLYARKPEGDFDDVAARREEYLKICELFPQVFRIDVGRPIDVVETDVLRTVLSARE